MRTFCVLIGILLLAAGMASAMMTTITVLGPDTQPVAGAKVYVPLPYPKQDTTRELVTDAAERTQVDLTPDKLPRRSYATAIVYQPGMGLVQESLPSSNVTVYLDHAAVAYGQVVDARGAPVVGAKVRLIYVTGRLSNSFSRVPSVLEEAFTTVTAADGRWQIDNLQAESIAEVDIAAPGYGRDLFQIPTSDRAMTPTLSILQSEAQLVGRVVNTRGEPVDNVEIECFLENKSGRNSVRTFSGSDGRFRLIGITPGKYRIGTPDSTDAKWVSRPLFYIEARAGEETTIPDVVVQEAAIITGRVLVVETQQPATGIVFVVQNATSMWGDRSMRLADDGTFSLAILPGSYPIHLSDSWSDSPYLFEGGPVKQVGTKIEKIDVQPGETRTLTFYVTQGKWLTGTVLDEQGAPVPDLPLIIRMLCGRCGQAGCQFDKELRAITDERGAISRCGIPEGPLLLSLSQGFFECPEWICDKPLYVAKADTEPVTLSVRRNEKITVLTGYVRDTQGRPVVGARVSVGLFLHKNDGVFTVYEGLPPIITDNDGRYTIPCRNFSKAQANGVSKRGYRLLQTGAFTAKDGGGTFTDCIMAKLDGTVSGKIVGIDGTPLADITVVSLEGGVDVRVKSGADGAFTLTGVPTGSTSVLAVSPTVSGMWWGETGATGVSIIAAPHQPTDDITCEEVLQAWVQHGYPQREEMAALFFDEGFERALQVWAIDGKAVTEKARATLLQKYAQRYPGEAAKIAVAQLDLIPTPRERFYTAIVVGLATAKINPVLGEHCYAIATTLASSPNASEKFERSRRLIELACALQHDKGLDQMLDDLLILSRTLKDSRSAFDKVVEIAEKVNPKTAEALIHLLPAEEQESLRQQLERTRNTPPALRALAQTDPATALAKVKAGQSNWTRLPALLLVMPYLPQEMALRECREIIAGNYAPILGGNQLVQIRAARFLFNHDPEAGRALLATPYARLRAMNSSDVLQDIPAYACYAAPADPVEARILLEVGLVNAMGSGLASPTRYALAMMAFHQRRALGLADALATAKDQAYVELLRYLRASEEERLWNIF